MADISIEVNEINVVSVERKWCLLRGKMGIQSLTIRVNRYVVQADRIIRPFRHEIERKYLQICLVTWLVNGPIWMSACSVERKCLSLLYAGGKWEFNSHDIRVNFYVLQVIKSFDLFDMRWKKVFTKMLITSLIMVRFEIRLHCWNCLSLLYAFLY